MPTVKNCLHCEKPTPTRVARGLCRPCWDQDDIREKFPPLAPFGGREGPRVFMESLGRTLRPPGSPKTRPKTYKVVPIKDQNGKKCWLVAEVMFEQLGKTKTRTSFLVPYMVFYQENLADRFVLETNGE
jgi:hypothetical protein